MSGPASNDSFTQHVAARLARGGEIEPAELVRALYAELRAEAELMMQGERKSHTLQPTALVHEAYLRMAGGTPVEWRDREHFLRTAARTMRRVLVDHARRRNAATRALRASSDSDTAAREARLAALDVPSLPPETALALDESLAVLAQLDPLFERVVELRFFAGLSVQEAAVALDVAPRRVERAWRFARSWLGERIAGGLDGS